MDSTTAHRSYHALFVAGILALCLVSAQPAWGLRDEDAEVTPATDDGPYTAEELEAVEIPEPEKVARSQELAPDDLFGQLLDRQATFAERLIYDPISSLGATWQRFNLLMEKRIGLRVGFAYTGLYQATTSRINEPEWNAWRDLPENPKPRDVIRLIERLRDKGEYRSGAAGDLDLVGSWQLRRGADNPTELGFNLEWRHRYEGAAPADLGTAIGSQWNTTSGFNNQKFTLTQLWLQQHFLDDRILIRMGKVDQYDFFNSGRFVSANLFFMNEAFSDNPAMAVPGNGIGFALQYTPRESFYARLGWGDANGRKTETDFSNAFDIKEWFSAVELGYTPDFERYGRGNYRLTLWNTDSRSGSDAPAGSGIALSIDQELNQRWVPFLRYGYSRGGATSTRQILALGACAMDPFNRKGDVFGIGVAWGQPYDRSTPPVLRLASALSAPRPALELLRDTDLKDQYTVELFYRMQITELIQVTPGIQWIVDPTWRPDLGSVGVFSCRFRVVF